jgi:hypothetical protein
MHSCEPSLEELKVIEKELMVAESTDENVKKLEALQVQIARHEKVRDEKVAAEKKAREEAAE